MRPSARTSRKSKRRNRRSLPPPVSVKVEPLMTLEEVDPMDGYTVFALFTARVRFRAERSKSAERMKRIWEEEATKARWHQLRKVPELFFRFMCRRPPPKCPGWPIVIADALAHTRDPQALKEWDYWRAVAKESLHTRERILAAYTGGDKYSFSPIAKLPQGSESRAYLIFRQESVKSGEIMARAVTKLFIEQAGGRHHGFSLEDGELILDQPYHEKRRLTQEARANGQSWAEISDCLSKRGFKNVSISTLKTFIREERMIR